MAASINGPREMQGVGTSQREAVKVTLFVFTLDHMDNDRPSDL